MGIHGESGVQKLKLVPCRQAVDLALGQLFIGPGTLDLKPDNSVLLFVNNLGSYRCTRWTQHLTLPFVV